MKKLLCLFPVIVLSFLAISCTTSKRVSFLKVEELTAQQPPQVDLAAYEAEYGGCDGVYLLYEETVEHSGAKDVGVMGGIGMMTGFGIKEGWNYSRIHKETILVLNPDRASLTTLELSSLPDKLYIRITSPDGRTAIYDESDMIEDKSKGKKYGYKFAYPDISKGSIIETAYEYAFKIYPQFFQYFTGYKTWLQGGLPCEKVRFTYAYPSWWEIQVKRLGEDRTLPYETVVDSAKRKTQLIYEAFDVPQIEDEPYSPYALEFASYADLMIKKMQMVGGDYSNPEDWQDWAKKFYKYSLKNLKKRAPRVKDVTHSLVSENDSQEAKLKAIIDYIYANIGIGKDQNIDCDDVLKDGEGAPMDITALASAMLSAAGVTSSLMLVHDAADGYFDEFYYDMGQLSIPALRVNIDGVDYVVFPYYKNLPVNLIPENFLGQPALLVPTDNPDAAWIWTLPEKSLASDVTDDYYELEIEPDGIINVTEKSTLRGMAAYGFRMIFEGQTEQETRDSLQSHLTYTDGDVTLDSYTIGNFEDYNLPLEIEMKYTIDNLVTVTPEEVIFQTAGLFSPLTNSEIKFDSTTRLNPICIHSEERYNKHITIRYPGNWQLSTELANVNFDNKFGEIAGTFQTEPGMIGAEQHLIFRKVMAPKEEIGELAELAGTQSKLQVPTLIFKATPTSGL